MMDKRWWTSDDGQAMMDKRWWTSDDGQAMVDKRWWTSDGIAWTGGDRGNFYY